MLKQSNRPMAVRKPDMAAVHAKRGKPHPLAVAAFYITAISIGLICLFLLFTLPEAIHTFILETK